MLQSDILLYPLDHLLFTALALGIGDSIPPRPRLPPAPTSGAAGEDHLPGLLIPNKLPKQHCGVLRLGRVGAIRLAGFLAVGEESPVKIGGDRLDPAYVGLTPGY